MEQASRWQLFNTSWTLHRLSPLHHTKDFETLLNNETALKAYAARLRDQLTGDVLAGLHSAASFAEDDTLSKTGALRGCRWEIFATESAQNNARSTASFPGILVTLEYENITYKAALLSDADSDSNLQPRTGVTALPLLLTKFPNALRQTFITFLTSNFDTYVSNLRLSSSFLCAGLEGFVAGLSGADVEDVIKELQLTLAFSPSIAPALRNVNVGIPRGSLVGFLREKGKGKSVQRNAQARVPLIGNLTAYLETHLAMKVDLDGSRQDKVARQHVRLAKVACAAFVLGSEGRMKLVVDGRRAVEGEEDADGEEQETPSLRASETLLRAVIRRAVIGDQVTT
jgi:hypothetical protein